MSHKIQRCVKCQKFFATLATKRAKCPRCGRSQALRPKYVTEDGIKAAKVVAQLNMPSDASAEFEILKKSHEQEL